MTPLQAECHQRHKQFHQAIAVRAALVPQVEAVRTYDIPNTPFGTPKMKPIVKTKPVQPECFYHCMWFFDLIQATSPRTQAQSISVGAIQQVTCRHYGVSLHDMLSARKIAALARPRQVAMYLTKKLTKRSLPEIGRRFDRDHTTALHNIRKITNLIVTDLILAADIAEIMKHLPRAT
jgi:hypothetical protein